jgi:hypothetical protein
LNLRPLVSQPTRRSKSRCRVYGAARRKADDEQRSQGDQKKGTAPPKELDSGRACLNRQSQAGLPGKGNLGPAHAPKQRSSRGIPPRQNAAAKVTCPIMGCFDLYQLVAGHTARQQCRGKGSGLGGSGGTGLTHRIALPGAAPGIAAPNENHGIGYGIVRDITKKPANRRHF